MIAQRFVLTRGLPFASNTISKDSARLISVDIHYRPGSHYVFRAEPAFELKDSGLLQLDE